MRSPSPSLWPLAAITFTLISDTAWAAVASYPVPSTTQSISLPATKPSNAVLVPGDFVGFGIETAFLPDFITNNFSEHLLDSVNKRLGKPIIIRIGGTSGDRVRIDPSQNVVRKCIRGDCPVGSSASYILNLSYFDGFSRFPNQHMTFQAPMGPEVNVSGSMDYVKRAYAGLGAERTAGIALGNEPDLYSWQYKVKYTVDEYVQDSLDLESNITEALGLNDTSRIFEAVDLASGQQAGFTIQAAFQDGINQNNRVKYAAQHWYQTPNLRKLSGNADMQKYLMNHGDIVSRFRLFSSQPMSDVKASQPDVAFILSETAAAQLGPSRSYQDGFGACLWAVDFNLYAMSQGVARLDATQRPIAQHALWVPDNSTTNPGPEVRAPYFAPLMVADFIGPESGSVVEVLSQDTLSGYAMYDPVNGTLDRLAIVNLKTWTPTSGRKREIVTVAISVAKHITSVVVQRLHADDGAAAQGYDVNGAKDIITWAGETFSYPLDNGLGHMVDGVPPNETVEVVKGVAHVQVPDSEAIIVRMYSGATHFGPYLAFAFVGMGISMWAQLSGL